MHCKDVHILLIDYIENTLEKSDRKAIKDHLATCPSCKQEFQELKKYKKQMNQLTPLKAPENFLQSLHERLEKAPLHKRIFNNLFMPFKIKIPLEAAGLLVTTAVVVYLFNPFSQIKNTVLIKEKTADEIASEEPLHRDRLEKSSMRPGERERIADKAGPRHIMKKSGPIAEKDKEGESLNSFAADTDETYVVILALNTLEESSSPDPGKVYSLSKRKAPARTSGAALSEKSANKEEEILDSTVARSDRVKMDMVAEEEEPQAQKAETAEEAAYITRLKSIILAKEGKIIKENTASSDANKQYLLVEIPASHYDSFMQEISKMGPVNKQYQSIKTSQKKIQLKIQFKK